MAEKTHVSTQVQDGILVAKIKGPSVSEYESGVILTDVLEEAPGCQWRIALDCSAVDYLSSAGIGMMVSVHNQCKANKGRVAVYGITPTVMEVLKLTKLHKLFKVVPDLKTALKKV